MKRVYRKNDPTSAETIEEILELQYSYFKKITTLDASSTTFKQGVCGRKYRRASWTCFILNSFNQQTGINAINVYANRLLEQMEEEGGSFPLTPLQGTYIIGFSNALFAILAILIVTNFGRRPIYIFGQLIMSIFLFVCGLSVFYSWHMTSFVMLNAFIGSFQLSQGSVAWLYIPEVTVDVTSGFASGAQFLNLILISLTFEFMINSSLKVYGSIWYFSAFCFVGFLFCLFQVRETRGLDDLAKKMVYSPKSVGEKKHSTIELHVADKE